MEDKTLLKHIPLLKHILNTIRNSEHGLWVHSWTVNHNKAEVRYLEEIGAIYKDDWTEEEVYYKADGGFKG